MILITKCSTRLESTSAEASSLHELMIMHSAGSPYEVMCLTYEWLK